MGRPKKTTDEKKIKINISLDRDLYNFIMKGGGKKSRIIEKIIREYCGNKDLR
jgi:metal-responsive CopG/Arc/MetJ family transcriptional regulator